MSPQHEPASRAPRKLRPWHRLTLIVLLSLAAVLLVARLAAPYYVRHAIDRRLSQIVKSDNRVVEPFFSADRIDFSIAWAEILRGRLVSQIYIKNGRLTFLRGADAESSQLAADKRWQEVINDLFPIDITYLEIRGGVLRFVDTTHTPRVDVAIRDLKVVATGLQNRPADEGDAFPAKFDISGVTIGDGQFRLFAKAEPLADKPHFQMAMELKKVSLPALNDFLKAYAHVEVSKGKFEIFAQMSMANEHYEGYVKPFIADLSFDDLADEEKYIGHRVWKAVVEEVASLATNRDSKLVATRIPFSGEANSLHIHAWKSIENGLHHGFVKALAQGFEGTPDPDKVAPPGMPAN